MVDTLRPPPSVIASWPRPNPSNSDHAKPGLEVIIIILTIFTITAVAVRLYTRVKITSNLGVDDLLVALGAFLTIVVSILVLLAYFKYYIGYHVWDVPVWAWISGSRVGFCLTLIYFTASCCIRISVLLFYRRLTASFTGTFLVAVWIGILSNIVVALAMSIYFLAMCKPINAFWDAYDPHWVETHRDFSCLNHQAPMLAHGLITIFLDLYSTILPNLLIRHLILATTRQQKLIIYGLFGLGYTVVAVAITRTVFVYISFYVDYDLTWTLRLTQALHVIELNIGMLAASAPALKVFLLHFRRSAATRNFMSKGRSQPSLTSSMATTYPTFDASVAETHQALSSKDKS